MYLCWKDRQTKEKERVSRREERQQTEFTITENVEGPKDDYKKNVNVMKG